MEEGKVREVYGPVECQVPKVECPAQETVTSFGPVVSGLCLPNGLSARNSGEQG